MKLWASYALLLSSIPVWVLENLSGCLLYKVSLREATCSSIAAYKRHAAKLNRPACLTPCNRHTLETLTISHVARNSTHFKEPKSSSQYSQALATCSYPKPVHALPSYLILILSSQIRLRFRPHKIVKNIFIYYEPIRRWQHSCNLCF
jgi:hypothetical protein